MKKEYIISFGDSNAYRLYVDGESDRIRDIKEEVKSRLVAQFPSLGSAELFDRMDVTPVEPAEAEKYSDVPVFDAEAVSRIEKVLSADTEAFENIRNLNDDAPWSNV